METQEDVKRLEAQIRQQMALVQKSLRSPRLIVLSQNDFNKIAYSDKVMCHRSDDCDVCKMTLFGVEVRARENFPDHVIGIVSEEDYQRWDLDGGTHNVCNE